MLTVVVFILAISSLAAFGAGLERALSVALFPIVIMTMMIERMSVVWEESGVRAAAPAGARQPRRGDDRLSDLQRGARAAPRLRVSGAPARRARRDAAARSLHRLPAVGARSASARSRDRIRREVASACTAKGVLGMNARNAHYISRLNPRSHYPLVDDKLRTKRLAESAGIAVPPLYGVIRENHELSRAALAARGLCGLRGEARARQRRQRDPRGGRAVRRAARQVERSGDHVRGPGVPRLQRPLRDVQPRRAPGRRDDRISRRVRSAVRGHRLSRRARHPHARVPRRSRDGDGPPAHARVGRPREPAPGRGRGRDRPRHAGARPARSTATGSSRRTPTPTTRSRGSRSRTGPGCSISRRGVTT